MSRTTEVMFELAARPQGVTNGELAKAAGLRSSDAGGPLASAVTRERLFKARLEGDVTHYFTTATAATSWADQANKSPTVMDLATLGVIAKSATAKLKGGIMQTSYELANLCSCTPAILDQALALLVDAGKMIRVNTQRSGIDMFTYRYSSCWVPAEADFNFAGTAPAPKAKVSAIAPPKPAPAPTAPPPAAKPPTAPPVRSRTVKKADASINPGAIWPGSLEDPPHHHPSADATSLGNLARLDAPHLHTPHPSSTAENLGFKFADEPESDYDREVLKAMVESPDAEVIEAGDLSFAINSLGKFVIDVGQGDVVAFTAEKALQLKRFLNNTTILESLEGVAS